MRIFAILAGMQDTLSPTYLLSNVPKRGLIRIVEIQNDMTLLIPSEDIQKDIVKIRFQLDMECFSNQALQADYTRIGLELFSIEPYLLVEEKDADLASLCKQEMEKLAQKGIKLYRG